MAQMLPSRKPGSQIVVSSYSVQMRIRDAMIEQGPLLSGIIEMDETYIGGKPRKGNNRDNDKHSCDTFCVTY